MKLLYEVIVPHIRGTYLSAIVPGPPGGQIHDLHDEIFYIIILIIVRCCEMLTVKQTRMAAVKIFRIFSFSDNVRPHTAERRWKLNFEILTLRIVVTMPF